MVGRLRRLVAALALLVLAAALPGLSESPDDAPVPVSEQNVLNFSRADAAAVPSTVLSALKQASRWASFRVQFVNMKPTYKIGEVMDVTIRSDRDCYVMVYYIDSSNKANVVCPSAWSSNNVVRAGEPFKLLDNSRRPLAQTGPAGTETLQVIATDEPIDLEGLFKWIRSHGSSATPGRVTTAYAAPRPPHRHHYSLPLPPRQVTHASSISGPMLAVHDPDQFAKAVELSLQDCVADRAQVVATDYKGLAPQASVSPRYSCFGIGTVKYTVRP